MKKITITYDHKIYSFGVNQYKIFYYRDINKVFPIQQAIRKHLFKVVDSEYSIEKENIITLKIDDIATTPKNTKLFTISHDFSIDSELKLKVNSLFYEYLRSCFKNIITNEDFVCCNSLYENLPEILFEFLSEDLNQNINFNMHPLDGKSIIKLIIPFFIKEKRIIHNYDLTYEEIILIQLKMIKKVSEMNPNIEYLINIPFIILSEPIIEFLNNLETKNTHILIFSRYKPNVLIDNICLVLNEYIDLVDEEEIYNKITQKLSFLNNLKDTYSLLVDFFNDNNSLETAKLKSIL